MLHRTAGGGARRLLCGHPQSAGYHYGVIPPRHRISAVADVRIF